MTEIMFLFHLPLVVRPRLLARVSGVFLLAAPHILLLLIL